MNIKLFLILSVIGISNAVISYGSESGTYSREESAPKVIQIKNRIEAIKRHISKLEKLGASGQLDATVLQGKRERLYARIKKLNLKLESFNSFQLPSELDGEE